MNVTRELHALQVWMEGVEARRFDPALLCEDHLAHLSASADAAVVALEREHGRDTVSAVFRCAYERATTPGVNRWFER